MSLSYLSHTYKPEPYIQPFNLDLMAKVLSVEQGKFEQEGLKIQNQIDQFGSLDVIKGIDKQYLNEKINKLVSNINNLGGVNLADQQVSSQIEGMGSDIYGDANIMNAVASTRQIRNLSASYEKYKTDPKLMKKYSKVNEEWDNQFVSAYMNDEKLGSSYSGPSSASPYVDYRDAHLKALKEIKANITTDISTDGVSFLTTEGKVVSPERVMAAAADLLTPDEKQQMEKDGWYAFKGANPLQVVQQSLDYNNQKLADAQMTLEKYKTRAIAAGNDPLMQQRYKSLVQEQSETVKQFQTASEQIQKQGLQEYNKDPHGYMAQVYKDQYYRGLGERFANSEIQSKLTMNPQQMANLKIQQQEDQFNQRMLFNAIDKGLGYVVDPITGKVTLTGTKSEKIKGSKEERITGADLAPLAISNLEDPELYKKDESEIFLKNKKLEQQKTSAFDDYWQQYQNEHPDISELMQSSMTGTGVVRAIPGQRILETTNKKEGLQIEDFNFDSNSPGIIGISRAFQRTNPKLSYEDARTKVLSLRKIYDDYNKMSHIDHNPDIDVSKIDPKLAEVVEKHQILTEAQAANEGKVKDINKQIYNRAGLTKQEQDLWDDYSKNPKKYSYTTPNLYGPGGMVVGQTILKPAIQNLKDKLKKVDAEKLKNELYKAAENRPVFMHQIITNNDPLITNGYLPNLVSKVLSDRGSDDAVIKQGVYDPKNIRITDAGRSKNGAGYSVNAVINVGTDKEPKYKTGEIILDAAQSRQLGFSPDPYQPLNESVYTNGSSNPMLISAPRPDGKALVAKIRLVKSNLTDRVDQSAYPQLVVEDAKGTKSYIKFPDLGAPTASAAYATMKTLITQFASKGLTLPQIVDQLLHPENYRR